jgi:hypothetical protein
MKARSAGPSMSDLEFATPDDIRASQRAKKAAEARFNREQPRVADPILQEIDYTHDEVEFANAMQRYKTENGRPFPAWSEVLKVIRSLGYVKMGRMA